MLHNISWGQFLTVTGILMAIYYGYIIVAYFRKDIKSVATKKRRQHSDSMEVAPLANPDLPPSGTNTYDTYISTVHELMDDLNDTFNKCASQKFKAPEIIMAIQLKLANYPQLKATPFQAAINNHIESEALSKCAVSIDLEEIKALW